MQISKPFLAVLAVAAIGTTACTRHTDGVQRSAAADASAVVIGTPPAAPTGDPPGTTPVDSGTSDVSKSVEVSSMPLAGQPNDHSNVAPQPSQRSETTDINAKAPTPESSNAPQPSNRSSGGAQK